MGGGGALHISPQNQGQHFLESSLRTKYNEKRRLAGALSGVRVASAPPWGAKGGGAHLSRNPVGVISNLLD